MPFDRNSTILYLLSRNLLHFKKGTFALDPPSIAAQSSAEVAVTINGLRTTDVVILLVPAGLESGLAYSGCRISAANTLQVRLTNVTAAAIDGLSRTWRYLAIRIGEKWY